MTTKLSLMGARTQRARTIVVALACFGVVPAHAQSGSTANASAEARAEAKSAFELGQQLFGEAQYEAAVVQFRRAYELSPVFKTLYSLGSAYAALGKPVEAVDTLQRYLAEGGANVPADKRTSTEAEIAIQKQRIAELTIRVSADGATVEIDGVEIGKSPLPGPVRVGVGERRIVVMGEGFRAVTRYESVAGAEQRVVEIKVEVEKANAPAAGPMPMPASVVSSEPADVAPPASPQPAPAEPGPGPWPWVVVGVSGAVMISGGVLLALAMDDLATVENAKKGTPFSELESAYDGAPVKSGAGFALLGVGAAGLAVGLIWALGSSAESGGEQAPVEVAFGLDRVVLGGSF